jgi:hypothetical protein
MKYLAWSSLLFLAIVPLAIPHPPTFIEVLVLLALLIVLGTTGWRLAGWLLPAESGATRISLAVLAATAHATVPATVLGHFGQLWPAPFFVAVASLAAAFALVHPGERLARVRRPSLGLAESGWARALAVAAVVALIASAAFSIHRERYAPPGFHGFDDNSYHLATVATWIERGDLAGVKFSHGDRSTPYYPIVGELVSWVLLAPFIDNDALARWSQLPYFLATLAAIAALGRRLRLPPRWTTLAVLLYAGLKRAFPILALGAGNDHAATFFTLAALDAALLLAAQPGLGVGVYLGLSLGLLLGTKFLGLLFAPLVIAVGIAALALRGPATVWSHARVLARAAAVAALVATIAGGYTYLRNAVTTGNPLYPVPIEAAGWELPGTPGVTLAERRHLSPFAIDLPWFLFRGDLFGSLGRFLWVPAALLAPGLALVFALRRPTERRRWLTEAAVTALPLAFFLVFLHQIHDHRDSRYLFPALAVAGLGAARLISEARARGPLGAWLEGLCLGSTAFLAINRHRQDLEAVVALTALTVGAYALVHWGWPVVPRLARSPALGVLLLGALLPGVVHSVAEYPERKLRRGPTAARALEREIGSQGTGVAYVGFNYPYPYWGSRLQNRVAIVPRNFLRDQRLYSWNGSAIDFSAHRGRYEAWQRNLRALDIRYVVVVKAGEEDPERRWMLDRPDRFERFFDDEWVELWRIQWTRPQSPSKYAKINGATIDASD